MLQKAANQHGLWETARVGKQALTEERIQAEGDDWASNAEPVRTVPAVDAEMLIVDVDGFEGPLDLLLELARQHKIDVAQISMLQLANQYLAFIENAQKMRLEVAADYLVMAAWLAYLKSRMLIPAAPGTAEEPAEDLAALLAFRLQRLQAMRDATAKMMSRNIHGRDVFSRGKPEPLVIEEHREYADNIVDLLKAYAERRQRAARHQRYTTRRLPTFSIKDARIQLEKLVGRCLEWTALDAFLIQYLAHAGGQRTVLASSFTASLELAREGMIELRQEQAFHPIFMRSREQPVKVA
jgi:segregation and condensation protein A